jgi:hypothetical protein
MTRKLLNVFREELSCNPWLWALFVVCCMVIIYMVSDMLIHARTGYG